MNKLIKTTLVFLVAASGVSSHAQMSGSTVKITDDAIAKIADEKITFTIDTLAYKLELQEKMFPKTNISFDKIEIKRQFTIGEERKEFYYILLHDFDKNIRVAKWLNRHDDKLTINDVLPDEGGVFEQLYLVCEGAANCVPQVAIIDSIMSWGCSENLICLTEEEAKKADCASSKMLFTPD